MIQKGLLALGFMAVVALMPRLISRLRCGECYSVKTLQQVMEENPQLILLDVRDEAGFFGCQGHIVGAVNIPQDELVGRIDELGEFTRWTIAVIDSGKGSAAEKAAQLLVSQGYGRSHPVAGGMTAWREAGYPVVR